MLNFYSLIVNFVGGQLRVLGPAITGLSGLSSEPLILGAQMSHDTEYPAIH